MCIGTRNSESAVMIWMKSYIQIRHGFLGLHIKYITSTKNNNTAAPLSSSSSRWAGGLAGWRVGGLVVGDSSVIIVGNNY